MTQNAGNRDGYQPSNHHGEGQGFRPAGRSPRPRIHVQRPYGQERTGYNRNDSDEGGFRPEGFGAGLQQGSTQRYYRPRYNSMGHADKPYRPHYNNADGSEDGYKQRNYPNRNYQQHGYGSNADNRQGGYQRGGYQQRGGYNRQEGGYRQGYNAESEGYGNYRQGGYQQRGGYNRQEGGYRQGYNAESEGYGNYRQGGYQQRGGYNRQGGGYHQRGGFNNRQGGYQQRGNYDTKHSGFKKRIDYKEENVDPNAPIRLNKYLANAGVCSRREADDYIQAGVVTVNGTVVTELGTKVMRSDEVKFHDQKVSLEKKVYVLLNKPKDYVTTSDDPQQRKTVMDLVKNACPERIYPVGRLDRNTTGVLLLTNDGDLASKLTHPKFLKKKIYHVFLDKNVTAHDMQQILDGIMLEDGEIKADDVQYADPVDKKQVGIEIHSGKNRIVRRIFEKLGYRVIKLDRVQFAGLTKKGVRRGDWRYLTEEEVTRLRIGAYE